MSFHEKSAWACLVSIGLIYSPYFATVLRAPMAGLGLFWVAMFGMIALLTIFHVANALSSRSLRTSGKLPPADELDQRIELRAAKWAGFVLAFALVTWILLAMYGMPILGTMGIDATQVSTDGSPAADFTIPVVDAMRAVHWLFAGFVFSQMMYYAGIVIGYRRMAGE
jgi:hypothetical protein